MVGGRAVSVVGMGALTGVGGAVADMSRSWGEAADVDVGVAALEVCGSSRRSEDVEEGAGDAASHLKRLVDGSLVAVVTSVAAYGSKRAS